MRSSVTAIPRETREVIAMTLRFALATAQVSTAAVAVFGLAACGGGGGPSGTMAAPSTNGAPPVQATAGQMADLRQFAAADRAQDDADHADTTAEMPRLVHVKTIGSTVDPLNGDQNPYGLDVAKVDAGLLHGGDLVVCNFSDAANVEGNGTTIVALHPQVNAKPIRVAQNAALRGCDALALAPSDTIWAAAFVANDNPIVSSSGVLVNALPLGPWNHPFGQTFAPAHPPFVAAFYASNAGDGSIVRINTGPTFTFDVIATGFPVNHGAPGSILGPSGLQYDNQRDALYVIDGADNSVTVLRHVSFIPGGGIAFKNGTATGVAAFLVRRIFQGAPLNGPISSALLPDGHLVIGNTLDPNGTNLLVEITRGGRLVSTKNVDNGPAGALFGMVATGRGDDDTLLYFNDDNDNTVKVLTIDN
jgi:hypothetical protein